MLIQRVTISASANPLRMGQLTITGRYGVLRVPEEAPLINNTNMRGEFRFHGTSNHQ